MSTNANGSISPSVCSRCGAMYLFEFATNPAWVCSCGTGGSIVGTAKAQRRKQESLKPRTTELL
jgi:hypothetical protein